MKTRSFQFFSGLAVVLTIGFTFSLFAQQPQAGAPASGVQAVSGLIGEGDSYTLGKDDVIEITVRNQPEFSGQFVVGPDGNIQYKFVGDVNAKGLTKEQLKDVITKKLESYVKVPEVSVAIVAYLSKYIYILGEVGKPGKYPMRGDTVSLRDAITAAGIPSYDAALRRVYVIKPDKDKPVYTKVDLYNVLYKGMLEDDLTLTPGDLVVVPSTVPSEINKALTQLLSPITRAAAVAAFAQ